ncbi:MAG: hypothetical protein HOP23_10585 [Methylococcaceae bacterium]|nr:hypothetical protein [Methylococcaceae bacterium]
MTSFYFIRVIKTLMVTTPFLTMILMVLALWGIGGKATYNELNATKQQMKLGAGEAKNYLVNGTKIDEPPATELGNPEIIVEQEKSVPKKRDPVPKKIQWGIAV